MASINTIINRQYKIANGDAAPLELPLHKKNTPYVT